MRELLDFLYHWHLTGAVVVSVIAYVILFLVYWITVFIKWIKEVNNVKTK